MKFTEETGINGHLMIVKQYNDGTEEVVLDDSNIIVSGMGFTLASFFAETGGGSNSIHNFQIGKFQLGVSGPPAGGVVSSINTLSGALSSTSEYGLGSNLVLETRRLATGPITDAGFQVFANIPDSKITKIGDSSVRFTLVLDEEACNGLSRGGSDAYLNEVALFSNNPIATLSTTNARPMMVAYRTFSDVYKTSDFSLIFRWTINF